MSNENRPGKKNWNEKVLSLYFVRHDPSQSGRKWLVRYDGSEIEGDDNMTLEKFERIAAEQAKARDEESILKSEAVGL